MLIDVWTSVQEIQETTGLSAAEIAALPMDAFARLSGRPTPAQAAIAALDARYTAEPPAVPQQPQNGPQTDSGATESQPQGVDVASMDMRQYAQLRAQLGIGQGQYGKGALDQAGGTQEWIAAARGKTGRGALSSGDVQDAPQIGRAFVQHTQVEGRASLYQGQ